MGHLRKNTKPIALTLAFVLFSSGLGYGSMLAYGQTSDQPCSVSHPCVNICGDHPCAPGEKYTLSTNNTMTTTTSANTTSSNQTEASGMSTDMGITANATVTKNQSNMTMGTNETMTGTSTNMTMTDNATATTSTNMTATSTNTTTTTSTNMTTTVMPPREQVASGTQPKDVQCKSGLELIINQFNSRPACVKSDIASMLVERGWGMLASSSP